MENLEIKEKLKQIYTLVANEMLDYKKISESQLETMKAMFGTYGISDEIYYNSFNLMFLKRSDYATLSFLFPEGDVFLSIDLPEYDTGIFVVRYFNDSALTNLLNDDEAH